MRVTSTSRQRDPEPRRLQTPGGRSTPASRVLVHFQWMRWSLKGRPAPLCAPSLGLHEDQESTTLAIHGCRISAALSLTSKETLVRNYHNTQAEHLKHINHNTSWVCSTSKRRNLPLQTLISNVTEGRYLCLLHSLLNVYSTVLPFHHPITIDRLPWKASR